MGDKMIRIIDALGKEHNFSFNYAHERVTFLLTEGFIEKDSEWINPLNGSMAGFYDKGDLNAKKNCIKRAIKQKKQ